MDDLLKEFLAETAESLSVLDVELVRFERDSSDATILSNLFRLMHTIKGTCGFLGLPRLGAVAHAGENILGKFRDGELDVTPRAVTLILKAIDRHPVSVTTADITGPATPVFLAGARLLEALPILPLINKVTVGVGALSYAGRFSMMVVADEDTCPDLDVFVTSARADLRTLTLSALAPSPARVGSAAPQ